MSVLNSIFNLLRFNSKNWKAVALCIFAATVFWFFNSLNKNYTTNISFPIEFDYDRENYVPVKPLPSTVRINVTGIGWDLFRRSLGLKIPALVVPLERPAETRKVLAVPALFAHQIERLRINFVLSDTFHIRIEPKVKRWITVRLDQSSLQIKPGYRRTSDTEVEPDSIFIEGPASLVRSFIEPVYLKLAERKLDSDYKEDVAVEFINNELIHRNPPTVRVKFKVDRIVVVRDSIKLQMINHPAGTRPYFGVNKLLCEFTIPERALPSYNPDSVSAVLDLRDFKSGSRKVRPQITGLPPYSDVSKVDSVFIKLY
jgi:hypothetical protein